MRRDRSRVSRLQITVVAVGLLAACAAPSPSPGGAAIPPGASAETGAVPTGPEPPASTSGDAGAPPPVSPPDSGITDRHADTALEALLPTVVSGIPLTTYSVTSEAFVGGQNADQFAAFLERVGATPPDVTLAVAGDPNGTLTAQVSALRVTGAESSDLLAAVLDNGEATGGTISRATIAGTDVAVVSRVSGDTEIVQYVHVVRDVAFLAVGTGDAAAALMLEVI